MERGNGTNRPIKNGEGVPRIITGIVIDIEDGLEEREFHIHILQISGPNPDRLMDRVWVKRSELRAGRCSKDQHFRPSTPFDRLLERHKAMEARRKHDRKQMQRIVANVAAMGAKLPGRMRKPRPQSL